MKELGWEPAKSVRERIADVTKHSCKQTLDSNLGGNMKTALVLGAGGFIGSHMVKRLREDGYWVRGVDLKAPEFSETEANEFVHR